MLNFVLHVPNLSYNLLFELNCEAKFSTSRVVFQERSMGRMIGNACEREVPYFFEDQAIVKGQAKVASSDLLSFPNYDEIISWYYRLGHPSFLYLQSLFPDLF